MSFPRFAVSPVLIAALFVWVAVLLFIPAQSWWRPFAEEPGEALAGSATGVGGKPAVVVPPKRGNQAGRGVLGRLSLTEDRDSLLVLGVEGTPGFGLEINDGQTGRRIRVARLPPVTARADHRILLDAEGLPGEIQLVVWNRGRSELIIETAEARVLRQGYLWPRRLFWLAGWGILLILVLVNRKGIPRYLASRAHTAADSAARSSSDGTLEASWRRWDAGTSLLILLLCFAVFLRSPVHQILDSKYISVVSHSLITNGSLAVPDSFVPAQRAKIGYTLRRAGDKTYHFFSSAPAVLNAPIVAGFAMAGIRPVAPEGDFLAHHELRILRFAAAIVAAGLCVTLFLIARVWLSPGPSLLLSLVFAFGTQIFSSISRPYWSHGWATLLLAGGLWLLVSPRWRDKAGTYVAISTLLCWAYFCRPSMSLSILGVTLFLLATRRSFVTPFVATGMIWAGVFLLYSWTTFGTWLPPYFLSSHLESGRLAGGLLVSSYPKGVVGTLISPGRGLFVYVPIFALILWVTVRRWKWIPDIPLAMTALGVCLAHWQLVSFFRNWWGGQSFGPRLMSDIVPWFFILAVLGVVAVEKARSVGEFRWTLPKGMAVTLIVAASLFVNTRGATSKEAQRGAGLWNWRYPSFMAGIIPRPDAAPDTEEAEPVGE